MPTSDNIPAALLDHLNPQQARAVSTLTGPLLVVAGPGSGKTTVLTRRIAALVATGTRSRSILAVTFTNKAAAEMRQRLATLLGDDPVRAMWVATFHSACLRILRAHHTEADLPAAFTIVDATDARTLIGRTCDNLRHTDGLTTQERRQFVKDTAAAISRAKNAAQSPDDVARTGLPDDIVTAQIMAGYNDWLAELDAVDFDDILLRTWQLLAKNPAIAEQYGRRFEQILVDEYQDTNQVQYQIIRILAAAHGNLMVVGDFDQSIYAFRGATPRVMRSFTQTFPGASIVELGENYRSTGNIVKVSAAVIAKNPSAHRAHLTTSRGDGEQVTVTEADTSSTEAKTIVQAILDRGGHLAEHAILVRTNALTRAFEYHLTDRHLPYQVVGGLRFYDRAEVKDTLSYLRVATNPADVLALERAAANPKRGAGPALIAAVATEAAKGSGNLLDALASRAASPGRGQKAAASLSADLGVVLAACRRGPLDAVRAVTETIGMRTVAAKAGVADDVDREGNLDELIDYARQFMATGITADGQLVVDMDGWAQTCAFLETIALTSAADTADGGDDGSVDAVQILTMHASKGKEYRHVYVAGLEENICPHVRAIEAETPEPLEEERRLLFVACSRAKDTLDLSHCATRTQYGEQRSAYPSRFLQELPQGLKIRVVNQDRPVRDRYPKAPTRTALPERTWQVGDRVTHPTFGAGVVVETGYATVTVDFGTGRKLLSATVAPLTAV